MNFPRFLWAAVINNTLEMKNLIILAIILVLLPALVGQIWMYLFRKVKTFTYPFLVAWVSGFVTLMAAAQLLLVPLTITHKGFAVFTYGMAVIVLVLMLLAIGLSGKPDRRIRNKGEKVAGVSEMMTEPIPAEVKSSQIKSMWAAFYGMIAIVLILGQGFTSGALQHRDDDDTRWLTEQNIAVDQGEMFTLDLVTNEPVTWNLGEQKKDIFAPWPMFMALIAKTSGIAPAVLSHTYMPMFLIPLAYAVYALFAAFLFHGDRERVGIFLIIISAINIYGYSSTHTTSAVLIFRMWQGKADVGTWIMPLALLLMLVLLKLPYGSVGRKAVWLLALCNSFAASLASSTGTLEVPIIIGICGLVAMLPMWKDENKMTIGMGVRIRNGVTMWCAAIPCVVYLLLYTFAQQILGY